MEKQYLSFNSSQTQKIAKTLGKDILKRKVDKKAFVIALEGELGSGKTVFVLGFAKEGLGIKQRITSPTFVLMKKFQIPKSKLQTNSKFKIQNSKFRAFYHIDCYRIQGSKELLDLGFKEIISNPRNIIAIEWADKIKKIIPKSAMWIKLKFINEKMRKILI